MKLYGNRKRPDRPERRDAVLEPEQTAAPQEWESELLRDDLDPAELSALLGLTPKEPAQPEEPKMSTRIEPREEHPRAEREAQERLLPMQEKEQPSDEHRLSSKTRALILCISSICVFAATLVMVLLLINNSKEPITIGQPQQPKELQYVVNVNPPAKVDAPVELVPPAGVNDSTTLNILLLAADAAGERMDTVILVNVDTVTREVGMLSIPRDTYISGNYDIPKLNEVYAAAKGGKRGIEALREKIKEMIGFWPDYYFIIDEDVLSLALDMVNGVDFEVPSKPAYCSLNSGKLPLSGKKAIELFRFDEDYDDVDPAPTRVQRDFLAALFDELLTEQDDETIEKNAKSLIDVADTDLTENDLLYFRYLLQDVGFDPSVSEALEGEEITVKGESYFEVDPQKACDQLNNGFNPIANKRLTVYQLNFRQKTGSSTDGHYSSFGFPTTKKETTEAPTDETEETGETGATDENGETVDSSGETKAPEPTEETPEPTSGSTEPTTPSSTVTPPTEGPDPTTPPSSAATEAPASETNP